MIEGVKINLGGNEFIVPPLSFKQLRILESKLKELGTIKKDSLPSGEQLEAVVEIIHAALSRNYPEKSKEQVEELLDLSNMGPVILAVMGVSGLVPSGEPGAGNL